MRVFRLFILLVSFAVNFSTEACTIVAVSGKATADGRPLLFKLRDSNADYNIKTKIGIDNKHTYFCQCSIPDGYALSGYNDAGFAIVNSHSYSFSNTDGSWNAYIMQLALENCSTVDDFEQLLNSTHKPMPVTSNYGVMDAQGNVAIFETGAYSFVRFNANDSDNGYLVRTNHSLSQDTTGIHVLHPNSHQRFYIASNYLQNTFVENGYISKESLLNLSRCLTNYHGVDLRDYAPFDENSPYYVYLRYYLLRRKSTSAILIQGVLPNENTNLTVAWTMAGPPMSTVTIPFVITPGKTLPQKAMVAVNNKTWLYDKGQQLKNSMFVDSLTIDFAKLYNLSGTGNLQKICRIEEEILRLGDDLMNQMRSTGLSDNDVATYYSWVDYYLEEQYSINFYGGLPTNSIGTLNDDVPITEYYDLLGRRVLNVKSNALVKKVGNKGIILIN